MAEQLDQYRLLLDKLSLFRRKRDDTSREYDSLIDEIDAIWFRMSELERNEFVEEKFAGRRKMVIRDVWDVEKVGSIPTAPIQK